MATHTRLVEMEEKGSGSASQYARFPADGKPPAPAAPAAASHGGHDDAPAGHVSQGHYAGLTTAEAQERFNKYGPNAIEEKKDSLFMQLFKHYIHGPMQYMIIFAAVLSGIIQHIEDLVIMIILLVVNGTLSFYEARKAGDAVAALKNSLAPTTRVFRDGKLTEMEAKMLVPGDKILVKLGDIIPADAKLLDGEPVTVDESALTGESLPVTRHPGQEILAGAVMKTGEIDAIVEKTGKDSFLGKSAALVAAVQSSGHFQKVIFGNAMSLVVAAIIAVAIILGVQLSRGTSVGDTLQLCVIVLVASIPITLPVVATGTLAVGSRKLARSNCIVSRLASIEEMAGMDILCSDKTGTLTKNQLTVEEPYSLPGIDPNEMYLAAGLASKREHSDAIDSAILSKIPNHAIFDQFTVEKFIPFDPVSKRTMARIRDSAGNVFQVSKGAPQALFKLGDVEQPEEIKNQINTWVERLASRGLRPLGVCRTDESGRWIYLGLISLFDPPRDDTRDTIEKALEMGVDVKMVTGDHLLIAIETAKMLGMGSKFYGQSFFKDVEGKPDSWVAEVVENADGFAQVYPEHKYFIVEALQKAGHLTGMTGDGVNDAPALKKADCGIAVQGATDAARAAADIILLSPGLSTIITAMLRSRKIFQRLKNYIIYRMNATVQILLFVFIAVIFLHDIDSTDALAIPAIILVLITIVNDGTTLAIAYDKVIPSPKPEKWMMTTLVIVALAVGIVGVVEVYIVYYAATNRNFLFNDVEYPRPPVLSAGLFQETNGDGGAKNYATFLSSSYAFCDKKAQSLLLSNWQTFCTNNIGKLKGAIFIALAIGGQLSVYVCRTHSFFFSRRPGFALLTCSGIGIIFLFCLGAWWFLGSDLSGVGIRNAAAVMGFLFLTFIGKDVVKVVTYTLIALSPTNFNERRARREMMRKINLYGTADEKRVEQMRHTRAHGKSIKH